MQVVARPGAVVWAVLEQSQRALVEPQQLGAADGGRPWPAAAFAVPTIFAKQHRPKKRKLERKLALIAQEKPH